MALQEPAHERADGEHPRVPASDVVEHPADELRSHSSPLERGVDLGMENSDEPGLGVVGRMIYYARDVLGNASYYIVLTIIQSTGSVAAAALTPKLVREVAQRRGGVAHAS